MDEGAGDGDALLFAAGEFGWTMAEAMGEANDVRGLHGRERGAPRGRLQRGEEGGRFDVFLESHAREKVEWTEKIMPMVLQR